VKAYRFTLQIRAWVLVSAVGLVELGFERTGRCQRKPLNDRSPSNALAALDLSEIVTGLAQCPENSGVKTAT
jgi:hypothetical protein